MQTKTKHFLNAILVAIFTTFVCCAVFIFGGLVKPEELASSEQPKVQNTLTLENDFSNNKYVIVGGRVYLYNSAETQTTGLTTTEVAISFDANNKLELIFMEDSVNALSSFAVSEENIASILTAEKTSENINITITDKFDEVVITTSHDAEYVLGELAFCSGNSLTYQNSQFVLESKPTTSFTATTLSTAKVISIAKGELTLSGSKTYSPKSGQSCRAVYQSGGTLTLTTVTLSGFSYTGSGGAIYQEAGTINLNCTITDCSASAQGGAIYSKATLNVTGGSFKENTAGYGGGAFCKSGGTATFANATVQDNITTTSYGHAIYADGGATVNVNSGTYATQNSSYPNATVIVGNATMNLSGGTLKGYNYVFDCFSDNAANSKYVLKGNPTLEATSGKHFWLSVGTYLSVETTLTNSYTVYKNGVTSIDDGDAATSYIAYSTNSTQLTSAKNKISVNNYSSYHQHSTAMKTNYLVCEYKSYGKTFNSNDSLGDASGFTQYNAGEYLDTGIKTNWDKDFTFSLKFRVSSVGNRYMLASSYNGTSHFAIELTTQNYLRVYLNNGAVDTCITAAAVPTNTTITVTFTWTASSNSWAISGSGTGYSQTKSGTYDMSGTGGNNIRLGALDYRGSVVFSSIIVGNFQYTTYQKYKTTLGTLPTPANAGYSFDGWFTASSGGTQISNSTTMPENGIICYAHWIHQPYYLAINPDNNTDEYYNETTYGAYIETAGSFNGSSTYKTVSRNYMFTDKITINVWASMTSWADFATSDMRVYSCTESGGWNLENASGKIQFACYDSGVGYKLINASKAWSTLTSGWHMFTMTFDGTNTRAYIDGTLYGTSAAFTSGKIGYHASNSIFIGCEAASSSAPGGCYFSGSIQDFTIVNDCFVASEVSNIYSAGRGKIIVSKNYLETYTIDNPTRTGYTFNSWTLTGSGDIEVGQGAAGYSGFTRTNNTYYENFNFSVTKPSSDTWYYTQWPAYSFTAGHSYRLTYKIRINTMTGTNFTVRFARLSNDYFGCPAITYSATTSGWVTGSMTQTLPASFVYSDSTKTVSPRLEIFTASLKSGTTSTLVIDFDIKDIVVTDLTNNTIVFASDSSYLFNNGNGTATATWTPNTYYVKFNGNGNTSGSMSNQTHTYDTALALTANTYAKTGHTFKGWSTSSTATTATYSDKQSVKNLTSTQGETVNLYAVWQINSYTLTINPNGGTYGGKTSNTTVTQNYNTTYTVANPTRTGYTFSSWSKSGSGTLSGSTFTFGAGNCTLTAQWTVNQYTVTFDPNGGYRVADTNYDAVTLTYDYGHVESISERRRNGYTLNGYTITDTSGGSNIGGATTTFDSSTKTGSVTVGTANIIVKMNWSANTIHITLNKNGGTGGTSEFWYKYNTNTFYSNSGCTTTLSSIVVPTKTGYTYTQYNGDGTSGGNNPERYIYTDGSFAGDLYCDIYKDATLYAQWTPNVYKATLDNQSATTAGTTEYYYQYNTTKTINGVLCYYYTDSACTTGLSGGYNITCPTKTGYTFGGYYTGTGGSGTQYVNASGSCVNNLYSNNASNITLYAKWTAVNYTITVSYLYSTTITLSTGTTISSTGTYTIQYGTVASASLPYSRNKNGFAQFEPNGGTIYIYGSYTVWKINGVQKYGFLPARVGSGSVEASHTVTKSETWEIDSMPIKSSLSLNNTTTIDNKVATFTSYDVLCGTVDIQEQTQYKMTETNIPENEVWLDDKFRKLQEQSETEVDFDGVTLL